MTEGTTRARGRRPAGEDTRAAILLAARAHFALVGYDAASMRAVARDAGVDSALVRHYFRRKVDLFGAVLLDHGVDPERIGDRVVAGGLEGLAPRLVAEVLGVWETPEGSERFRVLFASLPASDVDIRTLRAFLSTELVDRIRPLVTGEDVELRLNLVLAHLLGLLVSRHVLEAQPLAMVAVDEVVARVAPILQSYLEG